MQKQCRENADAGKNQDRQCDPAVQPSYGENNFDRVGVEDQSVNEDQRRERELGEDLQPARMFDLGLESLEIAGDTGEKKRRMKAPDHEKIQIRISMIEMQIEELIGTQKCKLQPGREHGGIKRR